VDDGSTDGTREVVDGLIKQDPRIRYVHQSNQGLSAARNSGLRHARGHLIQLLDADDLIEPEKLSRQSRHLAAHPELDLVYGHAWYFPSSKPAARLHSPFGVRWVVPTSGCGEEVLPELLRHNMMVVSSPLIRRLVFERVGTFNTKLAALEDWELWLRCAVAGCCFGFLDEPGTSTLIRFHPASMSGDQRLMLSTELRVHRELRPLLLRTDLRRLSRQSEADVAARLAVREALAGDLWSGVRRIAVAAISRPRLRWLVLAALMPALRLPVARRVVRKLRPGLRF
jgi:glycosyltransferase involved in cell wall biosynthesis